MVGGRGGIYHGAERRSHTTTRRRRKVVVAGPVRWDPKTLNSCSWRRPPAAQARRNIYLYCYYHYTCVVGRPFTASRCTVFFLVIHPSLPDPGWSASAVLVSEQASRWRPLTRQASSKSCGQLVGEHDASEGTDLRCHPEGHSSRTLPVRRGSVVPEHYFPAQMVGSMPISLSLLLLLLRRSTGPPAEAHTHTHIPSRHVAQSPLQLWSSCHLGGEGGNGE